jgi:hypothetical protein
MEHTPIGIKFYFLSLLLAIPVVIFFSDHPYYVIAAVGLLSLFYLILIKPTKAVYLLPLLFQFPLILIPNTRLHLAEFALLTLMFSILFHWSKYQLKITMPFKKTIIFIFLACILSFISSNYLIESLRSFSRYVIAFAFVFPVFYSLIDSKDKIELLVYTTIVSGLIASGYGILENYIKTGGLFPVLGLRIFAKVGAFYGSFLGFAIVGFVSLSLFSNYSLVRRIIMLLPVIPLGWALGLSQTRAWIVATIFSLAVIFAIKIYHSSTWRITAFCLIAVLALGFTSRILSTNAFYKVAGGFLTRHSGSVTSLAISRAPNLSSVQRYRFWNFGLDLFLQQPLHGIGLGNLRIVNRFNRLRLVPPSRIQPYIDNQYLQILIETGVLGALAWLSFIIPLVIISVRNVFRLLNTNLSAISVILLAGLVLNGVGGMFWVLSVHIPTLCMLAIIFALILSCNRLISIPKYTPL